MMAQCPTALRRVAFGTQNNGTFYLTIPYWVWYPAQTERSFPLRYASMRAAKLEMPAQVLAITGNTWLPGRR